MGFEFKIYDCILRCVYLCNIIYHKNPTLYARLSETFGNLTCSDMASVFFYLLPSSSFLSIATFANVMHLIMALTLNLKIRASNFWSVFYLATKKFSFKYQVFWRVIDHMTIIPVDFSIGNILNKNIWAFKFNLCK